MHSHFLLNDFSKSWIFAWANERFCLLILFIVFICYIKEWNWWAENLRHSLIKAPLTGEVMEEWNGKGNKKPKITEPFWDLKLDRKLNLWISKNFLRTETEQKFYFFRKRRSKTRIFKRRIQFRKQNLNGNWEPKC